MSTRFASFDRSKAGAFLQSRAKERNRPATAVDAVRHRVFAWKDWAGFQNLRGIAPVPPLPDGDVTDYSPPYFSGRALARRDPSGEESRGWRALPWGGAGVQPANAQRLRWLQLAVTTNYDFLINDVLIGGWHSVGEFVVNRFSGIIVGDETITTTGEDWAAVRQPSGVPEPMF